MSRLSSAHFDRRNGKSANLRERFRRERILNEAATLQLLKENSTIPIPHLYCCFEDDDAVYLVMEYVEGVSMDRLTEDQKARVESELEKHI